ncbi:KdsC family phosphatase [Sutterella megalosphaeroides]|uniref:3-deoxy-D-manno-octulosonate 8-phosphate phosphatase KdsC n=1 Tax=Sutterella megalosphaeroides TaxID=2494234 RepID=A0A2Z6I9C8_9BURK|nr:HAD-IIIA family hydrolase [Sutterella megalosphaeroides]BBF22197.1 3-deoxy-D-manno-octulosonate 8-phosphate phosphatase [Sutterella megalosphaeroides]
MTLEERARRIRLLVLDVDGVLTDGSINISGNGELFKSFNVRDGLGIKLLQKIGVEVAILTGRTSAIVAERARELGITHVLQGQRYKVPAYEDLVARLGLSDDEVAYMGDDLPDAPLLARAGLAATPADGNPELDVHWRVPAAGGHGAVRALAELIVKSRGGWDALVRDVFYEGR